MGPNHAIGNVLRWIVGQGGKIGNRWGGRASKFGNCTTVEK